jgi:hypothetical protein
MNSQSNTPNALTPIDGFDLDPSASPIRGANIRFKDGEYYSFAEKLDLSQNTYLVLDLREGWQKLRRDCPPEYLIRIPGEPKPPQPFVDEQDWPLNLNGVKEHPHKYTWFLHLLDAGTGETSTFSTNTTGGRIAIGELKDQIAFMRRLRPGALPVVSMQSKPMPTGYGGTKPRPHFKIEGWRTIDIGAQGLITSQVKAPSTEEKLDDAMPDFAAAPKPEEKVEVVKETSPGHAASKKKAKK